jgi:hypothetical protein
VRNDRGPGEPAAAWRRAGEPRASVREPRQFGAEVRPDRQLRPPAPGDLRQRQARPSRAQLATPLHLGVAEGPGGLSPQRTGARRRCACPAVNDVGKPCAGELHARFDRGPLADRGHGEPDQAPEGKPDGLSPDTYSLESQRPTSPPDPPANPGSRGRPPPGYRHARHARRHDSTLVSSALWRKCPASVSA